MSLLRSLRLTGGFAALILATILLQAGGTGGCGSATGMSSPPVNIPAPVAGLISVTSPDGEGAVRMAGAASSVQGGATVNVLFEAPSALIVSGTKSQSTGDVLGTATATSGGAFSIDFPAEVGNIVRVEQEGGSSGDDPPPPVFFEIRPGRILVPVAPFGAAISPSFSIAQTLQLSGSDTVIDLYSPSTLAPASGGDLLATGIAATDFALDETSQDTYLISVSESEVQVVDFSGALQGGALTLDSPVSVATTFGLQYAAVGQDSTTSITLIDNSGFAPALDASITLGHPTDGFANHVITPAISVAQDISSGDHIAAVANFDNGDSVFAYLDVTEPPFGSIGINTSFSIGAGTYDSIVLFNSASEVLISDTGNDRVLHLSGSGFGTQTVIPVGDQPRGIAIFGGRAFVCNRGSHTVSVIDLATDTVIGTMTTEHGVGLNPTDIATNPSVPDTALIANQGDNTVTLFDISDVFAELGI